MLPHFVPSAIVLPRRHQPFECRWCRLEFRGYNCSDKELHIDQVLRMGQSIHACGLGARDFVVQYFEAWHFECVLCRRAFGGRAFHACDVSPGFFGSDWEKTTAVQCLAQIDERKRVVPCETCVGGLAGLAVDKPGEDSQDEEDGALGLGRWQ